MQIFSIYRRGRGTLGQTCGLIAAVGLLLAAVAQAGEPVASEPPQCPRAATSSKLPPTLLISIGAEEPESLPAASEALVRLLYDLGKQRRLFSQVSAERLPMETDARQLHLEIVLHRRGADQANLKSWWPPITHREPDGTRLLFSSQLPLQAQLTLTDRKTREVRAEKTLVVQSKGRTVTAGTTDVPGIIIARDIKKYLREQHHRGVF